MKTRQEHLEFCKERALEYCDRGDQMGGLTSMFSDLGKHPDTQGHPGIMIGIGLISIGAMDSVAEARRFIEGFN